MRKINLTFLISLLTLAIASCSSDTPVDQSEDNQPPQEEVVEEPTPYVSISLPQSLYNTRNAFYSFSNELLYQINEESDENAAISPLSLIMALSMTANGATEEAKQEILNTLGVSSIEELNQLNALLAEEFPKADNQVKFALANSLWFNTDFTPKSDFLSVVNNIYKTETFTEPLSTVATMQKINAWVNDNTKGMIPKFLEKPLETGVLLYILNTTFFKGAWTSPFEVANTIDAPFTSIDGAKKEVATMHKDLGVSYQLSDKYHAITLPYGNTSFSMRIILPKDGYSINDVFTAMKNKEESLYGETLAHISLPKFSAEYKVDDYIPMLRKLGINKIFSDVKSLKGITDFDLYIGKVVQKTVIEVDESGAKAAAVTGMEGFASALPELNVPEEVEFNVNKPFIFTIENRSTGCILFSGVIKKL